MEIKRSVEEIKRLKELAAIPKEEMTLGQFFEYSSYNKSVLDGYVMEQKVQRIIADEFIRMQGKVDIAYEGQSNTY